MPEVTAKDINLYYEIYGEGQPLIFIHGFSVDHSVFSGIYEFFQDQYQVILLDNRGSGQSDCPDYPYTITMMVEDIIEFCRVMDFKACHFVGHSMGGMILQELAFRYPEKVLTATLCSTGVKIDTRYALAAQSRLPMLTADIPLRALIENGMGWTFSNHFLEQPGMIEKIINLRSANPFPITATGYKNQLNALLTFDSHLWVEKIKSRCLVIAGDEDIIVPELSIRKMAELIPTAHYVSIPEAGHAPFIEKPSDFNKILKNFLDFWL